MPQKNLWHSQVQGREPRTRSLLWQETEDRETESHPPGRPDAALCVRVRSPRKAELPSRGTKAVSQWGSRPMNETRAGGPPGTTAGWRACLASVRALVRSLRAGETRGAGAKRSSLPGSPAAQHLLSGESECKKDPGIKRTASILKPWLLQVQHGGNMFYPSNPTSTLFK